MDSEDGSADRSGPPWSTKGHLSGHLHLPEASSTPSLTHSTTAARLQLSVMGSAGGKSYVLCKTIIFFSSLLSLYSVLQYTSA